VLRKTKTYERSSDYLEWRRTNIWRVQTETRRRTERRTSSDTANRRDQWEPSTARQWPTRSIDDQNVVHCRCSTGCRRRHRRRRCCCCCWWTSSDCTLRSSRQIALTRSLTSTVCPLVLLISHRNFFLPSTGVQRPFHALQHRTRLLPITQLVQLPLSNVYLKQQTVISWKKSV